MECPKIKDLIKRSIFNCKNHYSINAVFATKVVTALQDIIIEKEYERVFRPAGMEIDEVDFSF